MNKIILFIINVAIVATPLAGIYFYFKLNIPKIKIKKTDIESELLQYQKNINQKLFPNYDTLLKFFEEPKPVEQEKSTLAKDLEKYQLIGISYSGKEKSMAIIKNKETNKQIPLKIGAILEGAVLVEINFENGFITFEKESEKYTMELTKLTAMSTGASGYNSTSQIKQFPSGGVKTTLVPKKGEWENKKPEEVIKIEKDQYTENLFYTDSSSVEYIKENLHKLAGEMYIRPVFTENADKLIGIKVEQIKHDSIFKKVGIREGDIVMRINDTPLSSLSELPNLIYGKELYEMKDLKVYILRDGKEIKIQVKVID